ncbi:hypothetical protein VB735_08235 [Halotia wernerae UHCC 0503]|nr:hypothetical protein [Halotia wernerae UHCC 0503]
MLQATSTNLIIPEPSEDLLANEPWSIEFYADGLMDELFADIDEILDASVSLPSQTVRHGSRTPRRSPEETTAHDWFYKPGNYSTPLPSEYETINVPQIVLPSTLTQVRHKQGKVVVDTPSARAISTRREQTRRALRKMLVLGATIGVAIAGTIYLFQSGILLLLTSKLTQPQTLYVPQTQRATKIDVEAELVDYMLGSLAIIDKQETTNNQQSVRSGLTNRLASNSNAIAFTGNQPVGNLPPPLAANNTSPTPNRSANVVERIYIPVYQAPSPMRYAPPAIPGAPTLLPPVATNSKTSQPDVVKTALTTVKQAAKPVGINMLAAVRGELKPLSVRTAPITVKQLPNPLPALPVVPFRAASPTLPTTTAPTQQQAYLPTTTAAAPSHTLEGLLELGNKSAALFQIDGVTRRINIGESVGSSGWTLVDVSNGEAIVRRNGEVRSIYAGQKL